MSLFRYLSCCLYTHAFSNSLFLIYCSFAYFTSFTGPMFSIPFHFSLFNLDFHLTLSFSVSFSLCFFDGHLSFSLPFVSPCLYLCFSDSLTHGPILLVFPCGGCGLHHVSCVTSPKRPTVKN